MAWNSTEMKMRRWREGQERGDKWVCDWCWGCQPEEGRCEHCKRFHVRRVTPEPPVSQPLPKQPKRPFLTIPQQDYRGEQLRRKRAGEPPLVAKTRAQQIIDAGGIPERPGGDPI